MKAITLWQPWATLIALGEKQHETRSWATDYRGPLVIHAAVRKVRPDELNKAIFQTLEKYGLDYQTLPLGAGLCLVDLVDVRTTNWVFAVATMEAKERQFGNFAKGRYAWKLANVRPFEQPIPAKGAQGLWEWWLPLEIKP